MSELFNTSPDNIGLHIKNIYADGELSEDATTEDYSVVRFEGKRKVNGQLKHYNLDAIISVGYRVNSKQGTQFRIWANTVLREYLLHGRYLYPSIEEQAAHLLYFIVKNHPFTDGNKRIGALIFIWFLQRNKHLLKENGEAKINDNALVAITLLVAQSQLNQKTIMIEIINLIKK